MAEQMLPDDAEITRQLTDALTAAEPAGASATTSRFSDLFVGDASAAETIDLAADASPEFRRSLNRIGNSYRIERVFAEGGFGRIFLARDRVLGRQVVVKSLREEYLDRPEAVTKFIGEAKLNAQLDHPSIVPLYSLDGDSAGGLHLAMQLVNGITLKELLRRSRTRQARRHFGQARYLYSLRVRLEAFLRICDAIEYSHSRGVVHCDLKPENIMIGRHGEVYVMDWGSACPAGADRRGRLEGTPAYLAPEAPRLGLATPQIDVFALGMILNEVVTLRGPVAGGDFREVMARIARGAYEPSTHLDAALRAPEALRAVIEKSRAVDPARRYATVKHLAGDVRHYLFHEEVSARPDTPWQKFLRYLYNHRNTAMLLVAAVFCASAVLALYGLLGQKRAEEAANLETLRRLKIQRVTENRADEIDGLLLRLREQLKSFNTSLGIEMYRPSTAETDGAIYLVGDFAPESVRSPSDLTDTPVFGRKISLEYAAFLKPDAMPRAVLERMARRLRPLHRPALSLLLSSVHNDGGPELSPEQSRQRFLRDGGLVRRLSARFGNGIGMRFPGMYERNLRIGDLQGPWVRAQRRRDSRRLYWSLPYLDSSGHAVLACWGPVIDPAGGEVGSAGIEICFYDLVQPLFEQNRRERFQTTYFLLSGDGRQFFSTDDPELEENHRMFLHAGGLTVRPFAHARWLSRFRAGADRQFLTEVAGRPALVSWTRIEQADWTLVQVVPYEQLAAIDLFSGEETLSDIAPEAASIRP